MQIAAIPETASSSAQWRSAQPQSKSAVPSFSDVPRNTSGSSASSSVPAKTTPPAQDSTISSQIATIAATYSTTVAGKSYAASIEESGGIYTASVPIPPGVSASGASIESAEINLNFVLDTLA
jgi:hypothetical protein